MTIPSTARSTLLAASLLISAPYPAAAGEIPADPRPAGGCPAAAAKQKLAAITAPQIIETSGIVASRRHSDVLWMHNDSGDRARLFAVATSGQVLRIHNLAKTRAIDWEDIALGPGPRAGVDYLYVGDIGDNKRQRPFVTIYRLAEPRVVGGRPPATIKRITALEMEYPDGPHDAEALLADPLSGDLYVVTKDDRGDDPTRVFRAPFPHSSRQRTTLEEVATMRLGNGRHDRAVTAGDISADGTQILLRTYRDARLWQRPRQTSIAEALAKSPCPVAVASGPPGLQDEAIAFRPDGGGYFTVSEGARPPIYFFALP